MIGLISNKYNPKMEQKRKEIASSLAQLVENDIPYISADWIKKNVFGLNENDK